MAALQPVCYFKSKSKSTQFRQTIFISSYFYNYQNIIKNQAHTCSETLFGQIKLKSKQSLIEQYLIYQLHHFYSKSNSYIYRYHSCCYVYKIQPFGNQKRHYTDSDLSGSQTAIIGICACTRPNAPLLLVHLLQLFRCPFV